MSKMKKIFISFMMLCLVLSQSLVVFAVDNSGATALSDLIAAVSQSNNITYGWNYDANVYKCSDGGFKIYSELAKPETAQPINEANLESLTAGAKNDFLEDYFNAGMTVINHSSTDAITEEVGTNWLEIVQNTSGVGSQLITTLMAQTKPDYVTANRIYEPFSGTVGTILGVISVLLIAALTLTMVLDLAYIAIPAFQLFVNGDDNGQGGKKKSFISQEAMNAVQMAEGGQGGGGQNGGSQKLAVSIYFKKRVIMLVILFICILYLISGNIFAFIGSIIDLFSGFLGF